MDGVGEAPLLADRVVEPRDRTGSAEHVHDQPGGEPVGIVALQAAVAEDVHRLRSRPPDHPEAAVRPEPRLRRNGRSVARGEMPEGRVEGAAQGLRRDVAGHADD